MLLIRKEPQSYYSQLSMPLLSIILLLIKHWILAWDWDRRSTFKCFFTNVQRNMLSQISSLILAAWLVMNQVVGDSSHTIHANNYCQFRFCNVTIFATENFFLDCFATENFFLVCLLLLLLFVLFFLYRVSQKKLYTFTTLNLRSLLNICDMIKQNQS